MEAFKNCKVPNSLFNEQDKDSLFSASIFTMNIQTT